MLNADEYNKLEEAKPQEKERKEPSWFVKCIFGSIFIIGWMLFLASMIVMPFLDAYDDCDMCPLDYREDAHLSKVCRYTPEPHILYERKCYTVRPHKYIAMPMLIIGALMIFGGQWSYFYYDYKLNE